MGNSPPRVKLHYVKEENRTLTGLIQLLNVEKGTAITNLEIYVVGREKISWFSAIHLMALKEDHAFFRNKYEIEVKENDHEPTFSIQLPSDLPPSGHGGNYGKGAGYAIGYHVLVEAKGNSVISELETFTMHLGPCPPSTEVDKGEIKFGGKTLSYEIPKGMPRGETATLKFKISGDAAQRIRIRLREEGKQLKGQKQTDSEIKYELEDEAIGTEWTPVEILISRYANTPREGKVLKISHVMELTAIGTEMAEYKNIPVTIS